MKRVTTVSEINKIILCTGAKKFLFRYVYFLLTQKNLYLDGTEMESLSNLKKVFQMSRLKYFEIQELS